ncbi:helix-hairpin-helix domain-containing protein [Enterobacter hormaechei]|uniref:helix-hairpin-helix domain-containing protein n=1 Tax=Enterobacter hormaechei TaxID=158836 RepID=UPI003EBCE51B
MLGKITSLKSEGVNTLRALSSMNEYELIKIKGIGKITAQKIINSIKDLEVL